MVTTSMRPRGPIQPDMTQLVRLTTIEANTADEAIATASGLPLMKEGMLRVEATYPLAPYRGFVGK